MRELRIDLKSAERFKRYTQYINRNPENTLSLSSAHEREHGDRFSLLWRLYIQLKQNEKGGGEKRKNKRTDVITKGKFERKVETFEWGSYVKILNIKYIFILYFTHINIYIFIFNFFIVVAVVVYESYIFFNCKIVHITKVAKK